MMKKIETKDIYGTTEAERLEWLMQFAEYHQDKYLAMVDLIIGLPPWVWTIFFKRFRKIQKEVIEQEFVYIKKK